MSVLPRKLTAQDVRVCVTGYDHNRPDPFPGMGDFIGWAEAIERMPDGGILYSEDRGISWTRSDRAVKAGGPTICAAMKPPKLLRHTVGIGPAGVSANRCNHNAFASFVFLDTTLGNRRPTRPS